MKRTTLILLLFLTIGTSFAQERIAIYKSLGGPYYKRGSITKLSGKDLVSIMQKSPNIAWHEDMQKAVNNQNAAKFFGYVGGFLFGWGIGGLIAGGDEGLAGVSAVGVGIMGIAIPFQAGYNRKSKKTIIAYNKYITEQQNNKNK